MNKLNSSTNISYNFSKMLEYVNTTAQVYNINDIIINVCDQFAMVIYTEHFFYLKFMLIKLVTIIIRFFWDYEFKFKRIISDNPTNIIARYLYKRWGWNEINFDFKIIESIGYICDRVILVRVYTISILLLQQYLR